MTEKRFTMGSEILKKENKCCICNSKSNLEPHHILHTTKYDELHDSIENLVVMCHNCHHNYHQQYNQEITFRTLLEFQKKYWKKYCPKLRTKKQKITKTEYGFTKKNKKYGGMSMEKYEEKNYKVTVNDLYIELKKLVENGDGDKPVKLSVNWDNCEHLQNLRAFSEDYGNWILLMGYK